MIKIAVGGAVLVLSLTGVAHATEAEDVARTQAAGLKALGGRVKIADAMFIEGISATGNRLIQHIKVETKEKLAANSKAGFSKSLTSAACADQATRALLSRGVVVEYNVTFGSELPVAFIVDAAFCGVKLGEKQIMTEADLNQYVANVNKHLPAKVHEAATLDKLISSGLTLTYHHTVTGPGLKLDTKFKDSVIKQSCNEANTKVMIDGGVKVILKYMDQKQKPVATININADTCKQYL